MKETSIKSEGSLADILAEAITPELREHLKDIDYMMHSNIDGAWLRIQGGHDRLSMELAGGKSKRYGIVY
ncbi:MAG TPA: hypothetical protein VJJ21_03935 [Candidatus Nanoarchaeia archaeon]|nr:hypothetical protein [Candidatus Nanoarchaeia archaeon]